MPHRTNHSHPDSHQHSPGHSHPHVQGSGGTHHHAAGQSHSHAHPHAHGAGHGHGPAIAKKAATFNKIFRWQQEPPEGPLPVRVEVAGTFSGWQKLPLKYDRTSRVWQLAVENIPGNRTHNYMLLVNGRPTNDKHSDGLAIPHTPEEKQHSLETPRGPRVFMLFSQTK